MKVSLFCGVELTSVSSATDRVRLAAESGFDGVWFAQGYNLDAITAIAVVGSKVPGIELGTGVVPFQGRHPIPLALAALTASDAIGAGRFTLGLGATHRAVSEGAFGIPYSEAVARSRDVLAALHGLLSDERATDYDGETLSAHAKFPAADLPAPRVLLAALGPKMLDLAGQFADGTITWMTGPTALGRDVVPALQAAATRHNRSADTVVVGLPVCITDDVEAARERVSKQMGYAAVLDSYKRMLSAEGVADPVDIALIGSPDDVRAKMDTLAKAGMTEMLAYVHGTPEEQARTLATLPGVAHS